MALCKSIICIVLLLNLGQHSIIAEQTNNVTASNDIDAVTSIVIQDLSKESELPHQPLQQQSITNILPTTQTACTTPTSCLEQSKLLSIIGVTNFNVGTFTSYGCYYKGDTAYFGVGGTDVDMSESPLPDGKTRIWCQEADDDGAGGGVNDVPSEVTDVPTSKPTVKPPPTTLANPSPTYTPTTKSPTDRPTTLIPTKSPSLRPTTAVPTQIPTPLPTNTPSMAPSLRPTSKPTPNPTKNPTPQPSEKGPTLCRNQNLCNRMREQLGYQKYLVGDFYPKGCFADGDTVYFGLNGSEEEKSLDPLADGKERIWCDFDSNESDLPDEGPTENGNSLTDPPSSRPTKRPTKRPTLRPSLRPTNKPTAAKVCIDMKLVTDKYGSETGFFLRDESNSRKLVNFPVGSLKSEQTYTQRVCVPPGGQYEFKVLDSFYGVCCSSGRGYWQVKLDGTEIIYGGSMDSKTKSVSYTILPGYEPEMNNQERQWLIAHNTRREEFHTANNKSYRPLLWSQELADDAERWVDVILPTCKRQREENLLEGENMHQHLYSNDYHTKVGVSESPDDVLERWADKVLDLNKDYPDNQTMTQVMWRASRYVGCSNKSVKYADGSYCYVSICRYLRAGNCSMKSYDSWKTPTLMDSTGCGRSCPEKGCY